MRKRARRDPPPHLAQRPDRKGRSTAPRRKPPPYASLSATWLATRRMLDLARHQPAAFRLLLLAHAGYNPNRPTLLPWERTRAALRLSDRTLARAFATLAEAGLIERTREAIRPGGPGNAAREGRAAEYRVALRRQGEAIERQHGDRKRDGYLRADAAALARLAGILTDAALPAWCWIAGQHRTKRGALQRLDLAVTAAAIAEATGQATATAHRAVADLIAAGELRADPPAEGEGKRPVIRAAGILAHGRDAPMPPMRPAADRSRARGKKKAPTLPQPDAEDAASRDPRDDAGDRTSARPSP